MTIDQLPDNYLNFNTEQTKEVAVVVQIEGVSDLLSTVPLGQRVYYGFPGIKYGDPGLVYGGLKPLDNVKSYLSLEGSTLSISQKLEPEQGRASVSTMTLSFIDKDQYMTQLLSPGIVVDDIIGKGVKVWLGFQQTSYPDDFFIVFRGKITQFDVQSGRVSFQTSDPNVGRRQYVFSPMATTKLLGSSKIIESVDPATDEISSILHGFTDGTVIQLSTTKTLPSPLNPQQDYFVVSSALNTFKLSDTLAGSPIDITSLGEGALAAYVVQVGPAATTIPVAAISDFHQQILGPDATYDPSIKTYIKIEDEFIEYPAGGVNVGLNRFEGCVRGARHTLPASHAPGTDVTAYLQIEDNAIVMALKLMLSGWNGPWKTSEPLQHVGFIDDPLLGEPLTAIVLGTKKDAVRDYGLAVGEYITLAGCTNPANDKTVRVVGFSDLFKDPRRIVYTDSTFIAEPNSPGLMSFRSQFDTLPITCGVNLTPDDVDIAEHINLRDTYLSQVTDSYRFLISQQESCKSFIETELFLPSAAYSLTRQGRLSVGYTKPPLADQRFQVLSSENVLEPAAIKVNRGTNNRKFFNVIQFNYDFNDAGDPTQIATSGDVDSLSIIKLQGVLPITTRGARTDLGFLDVVDRRTRFLLSRYKRGAYLFNAKVNWEVGSQIEAGDVLAFDDRDGILQIPNFATGQRGLGLQLCEVIDRTFDIKTGQISLGLVLGVSSEADDRFGTISPSSLTTTGSTTTIVRIKESFGEYFINNEQKKWTDYFGLPIIVHSYDWSVSEVVTLVGLDPGDDHGLLVTPPLSFTPPPDYVIDIANYPTSADPEEDKLYKLVHAFIDPTVTVVSGTSATVFDVGGGDVAKFLVGAKILIHNTDFSILSPEVKVLSVVGTTITTDATLGFTPAAGQKVELIGFADGGGAYRFI